jgi:uncharacterized protein (TIGR02145 family)
MKKLIILIILATILIGCKKIYYVTEISGNDTVFVYLKDTTTAKQPVIPDVPIITLQSDSVQDASGNWYKNISIGAQVWLSSNLKTTKYNNGDNIPTTTVNLQSITEPKYQFIHKYNTDVVKNGRLYTWYVIDDTRGIAPIGYHIPTNADWNELTDYLKNNGYGNEISNNNIGKSLAAKEGWLACVIRTTIGYEPEQNNTTGFNAIPCGNMSSQQYGQSYDNNKLEALYWSATEEGDNLDYRANIVWIRYDQSWLNVESYPKDWAFSVRCVKNK